MQDSSRSCHSLGTINYYHDGISIYIIFISEKWCLVCASQSREGGYSLYREQFSEKSFYDRRRDSDMLVGFRFSLGLSNIEPCFWAQSLFFILLATVPTRKLKEEEINKIAHLNFSVGNQLYLSIFFPQAPGPKAWGNSIIAPDRNTLVFIMAKWWLEEDWSRVYGPWVQYSPGTDWSYHLGQLTYFL